MVKGGEGAKGGGCPPLLLRCTAVLSHHCPFLPQAEFTPILNPIWAACARPVWYSGTPIIMPGLNGGTTCTVSWLEVGPAV